MTSKTRYLEPFHPNIKPEAIPSARQRYRTVWVSDVHLGARSSKAQDLLAFLKTIECETLYFVGDIIDFWKLRRKVHWPAHYTALIAHVARLAESGVRVVYVPGNHDAEFRGNGIFEWAGVQVRDEVIHHTADGKRLLVTHGDAFDDYGEQTSWLVAAGDRAYSMSIVLSEALNWVRRKLGMKYWSLSLWLKHRVKSAVGFIGRFEERVLEAAVDRRVDGVVCGHIHKAELREVQGVIYANDGDWVESCTAIVEQTNGQLGLLQWDGVQAVPIAAGMQVGAAELQRTMAARG